MLTVYTSIFGRTYKLQPPEYRGDNIRYLCFTDDHRNKAEGVKTIIVEPKAAHPELAAKWHKWHPPDGDTLYLDSAYQLTTDPTPWFRGLSLPLGLCSHAVRSCVFFEAKTVEKYRPNEAELIRQQMKRYKREGLPLLYGLWEGGIIFRRGGSKNLAAWNELVWGQLQGGCIRDQLAIPYCLWSLDLACDTLPSHLPQMVRQHRQVW